MRTLEIEDDHSTRGDSTGAIDKLISEQGVKPVMNLDELAELWPANDDPDALLSFVLSERQARLTSAGPQE